MNLVFTGTYDHTIDPKGRLSIPSEVRAQLQRAVGAVEGETIQLYVVLGGKDSLALYGVEEFEQRAAELDRSELDAQQVLEYERILFSLARRVEVDKQGRIRLPPELLARTGLEGDVVLIGAKDHLEVRDRMAWTAYLEAMLDSGGADVMNPRQFMRRAGGAGGSGGAGTGGVAGG